MMDAGLMIPMIGILSLTTYKITKLALEHEAQKLNRGGRTQDAPPINLERRVRELEHRVTTLQDLVIGGEYEVRRKLEAHSAEMDSARTMSAQSPTASTLNTFSD